MPATATTSRVSTRAWSSTGLIIPVGVQGAFGRGAVFEDVLERFNGLVTRARRRTTAPRYYTFPPVIDRTIIEKTDYLDSFPHLAGTVFSFFGKELRTRKPVGEDPRGRAVGRHAGHHRRAASTRPPATRSIRASAGTCPTNGRLVTMSNWVYRHEPSPEPTRMQSFRVREFVRVGTPDMVVAVARHVAAARPRAADRRSACRRKSDVASDPFFGRGGKMLADGAEGAEAQVRGAGAGDLAREADGGLLVQLPPGALRRTCSASTPRTAESRTPPAWASAWSACVMALFKTHGFDPERVAERGAREALAVSRRRRSSSSIPASVPAPRAARAKTACGSRRTATSTSGSR